MAKKRVFIGVPFHSPMDILAVTSLANLISHCIRRGEYEIKYTFVARAPVSYTHLTLPTKRIV